MVSREDRIRGWVVVESVEARIGDGRRIWDACGMA